MHTYICIYTQYETLEIPIHCGRTSHKSLKKIRAPNIASAVVAANNGIGEANFPSRNTNNL